MLCSSASIVAPASSRQAGFPFVVGNMPHSAGRSMPRMRPSTRSAAAIVAPVLPADTTASASPCLTIDVATPIEVSARRRSAVAGCSSMPTTSFESRSVIPGGISAPTSLRTASSRPTSTRSDAPPFCLYNRAPRTISSGAWSPPIASTAIFTGAPFCLSRRPLRLDRYDLAAAERAALRARVVRRLRVLALRARHEIGRAQREMTAALALCRARYPFLGLASQKRSPRGGFVDSIGRMIEPTWQVAVFVAFRLVSALPTLRWPFAGALLALVADFADLFLMDAIGGISDYQRLDKLCDLGYIAAFLVVAARWSGLERIVAFVLFGYRMVGEVAFEVTGQRALLLLFPNVFEFWFVAVAARRHYRRDRALTPRQASLALFILLVAKEAQEYFLHVDQFLDQFSALGALQGIWNTITRR